MAKRLSKGDKIAAVIGVAIVAGMVGLYATTPQLPTPVTPISPIIHLEGIGTGFHIGQGVVLTAGHVADVLDAKSDEDKEKLTYRVMWRGKRDDVAILHHKDPNYKHNVTLDMNCSAVKPGDPIRLEGFPLDMGRTITYGRVASEHYDTKGDGEGIKQAIDVTAAPGNSGSPVLDNHGKVVGIMIEVRLVPIGMFPSLTRFSVMLPSTVICEHLGRV